MSNTPNYQKLYNFFNKVNMLTEVYSAMHWDASVMLPLKASEARGEHLAAITDVISDLFTNTNLEELVSKVQSAEYKNLEDTDKRNFDLMQRRIAFENAVDDDLKRKLSIQNTKTQMAWTKAKSASDFSIVAGDLQKSFDLTRRKLEATAEQLKLDNIYDACLKQHDFGLNAEIVTGHFNEVKDELISMFKNVKNKNQHPKTTGKYSQEGQMQVNKKLASLIGFDFDRGRLDLSAHPFCTGGYDDNRITTRFDGSEITQGMSSTIHEIGHSFYNKNLPVDLRGQPVGTFVSYSIHESQSLFWEKHVYMTEQFMQYAAEEINNVFGTNITAEDYLADNMFVNRKNCIRVNADEITYPLHVLLRFEIEKGLFEGEYKIQDLNEIWNAKFEDYFGFVPPSQALGCLQDIHWYWGFFGYFPAYFYGSAMAAQLAHHFRKEHDLEQLIADKKFSVIESWHQDKIHSQGYKFESLDLMRNACGEDFSTKYYIDHLRGRYNA